MTDGHPCSRHRPGEHTEACLAGPCGFCGTDLQTVASGECRRCLRIVCEACDGGYQADLGPICQPCHDDPGTSSEPDGSSPLPSGGAEQHRLCVFELDLSCGHVVTLAVTGWYPVMVTCCDRLGGTVLNGRYVPYAARVDYVRLLSERYVDRPAGIRPDPSRLIHRFSRTDDPSRASYPSLRASAGRFPARVGAVCSLDGSVASQP